MYNKILKGVASALSAVLMLGCVVTSVIPASAKTVDGNKVTYTAQELEIATDYNSDGVTVSNADNGAISVVLPGQWNQVYLKVPQEVIDAGWQKVEVDLTASGGHSIKLDDLGPNSNYIRGIVWNPSADYIDRSVDMIDPYGTLSDDPAPTEADFDKILFFSVMNGEESQNDVTIKSITFTVKNAIGGSAADDPAADDPATDSPAADDPTSSKTGESLTNLYVVCALGGLLLIAAAGTFVTEQKKRR